MAMDETWTRAALWDLRQSLGLSRKEFAEQLGVSIWTVQGWQTGRRRPGARSRRDLARLAEMAAREKNHNLDEAEVDVAP